MRVTELGRLVLEHTTPATETTLDIRHLAPGLYVLHGQGGGLVFTRRVVVR